MSTITTMRPPRIAVLLLFTAALCLQFPAAHALPGPSRPSAAAGPPNIILILTDDQDVQLGSVDYMSNVKSLLAQQGTTFSNFYVPLSLCCPSRTTILRGQFPHNTGVLGNSPPNGGFETAYADKLESATVATLLHNAGYRTVLLGKYLNGYPDTAPDNYIPPGWDEWYSPVKGNPYSEYHYMLNENGKPVTYGGTPADYLTDVIHAKAVDFIQRATAASASQPLFVYFATYAPHSPYTPAPRHANLFPDVKAPRPPSFNEPDVTGKPGYIKNKALLTQTDITGIDSDYRDRVRALQAVDEAVADIVATLTATGRLANTYIFFASDNGYHMGEHRLLSGKYTPYETDIRVPLIVRGPGIPAGAVRQEFAANLDLEATFADLAGVAPQPFSDGRSLKPLFGTRPTKQWRQAFLLEEFNQGEAMPPDDIYNPASTLGIREPPDPAQVADESLAIPSYYGFQAPGYKYITYLTTAGAIAERELYASWDPFELTNLASLLDPSSTSALDAYLRTLINCKTDGCRSAEAVAPPALPASLASPLATPIPATFFAMSTVQGTDYPKAPIGTLAHLDFAWGKIEQSRGSFSFLAYDNAVAQAQLHGLVDTTSNTANMAITLAAGTPAWAVADQSTCSTRSSGTVLCTAPPDNIQDWKDFLTALIQHYNGKTQPHIRYYELWNEFNVNLWWTGTDAQMVALAQAAFPIIHEDPVSMLLTPSVAGPVGPSPTNASASMASYLKAGGSQYADGCAYHGYIGAQSGVTPFPMPEDDVTSGCNPFTSCYGSVITRAGQMRAVFDQNGLAGKPMFQTEGSWGNSTVTDPDAQVAWLTRFYLLHAGLRASLNLQMNAWFTWANPSFGWGNIATADLQPTAAGLAYGQVYNWLVGATIAEPCAGDANNTWTCKLTRSGNYVAQAVWNTQGPFSYTPGAGFTQFRDLSGAITPLAPGTSVTIGAKPILIEGRGRDTDRVPGVVPFSR
jgi:N-acetylglucosamine-6-sulfatase